MSELSVTVRSVAKPIRPKRRRHRQWRVQRIFTRRFLADLQSQAEPRGYAVERTAGEDLDTIAKNFLGLDPMAGLQDTIAKNFLALDPMAGLQDTIAKNFLALDPMAGLQDTIAKNFLALDPMAGLQDTIAKNFLALDPMAGLQDTIAKNFLALDPMAGLLSELLATAEESLVPRHAALNG
ncbi:hypothetical protein GA0074692_3434 [Micromonospora pallida]|uniref:Uncharacterized protein n=1 Tax=Micromonospora pallida TaxID=145854 RepID=A0A1C6STN0_9ACTN|nr:hypothetical protein GA0074692_3434 [Micromonospora pallida]